MLNKNKILDLFSILTIITLGAFLRFIRMKVPGEIYFDETYYIKAAKDYLHLMPDSNWMHPPLGKIIMSSGIFAFGDNPFGWRITGVVFGILMIFIFYLFAGRLFKSRFAANCAAFLMAICPFNIVMSKIALLDIYLTLFTLLGFYFLYLYCDFENNPKIYLILSIASFALSFACKWSGIFGIIGAFIILIYYKYKKHKVNPVRSVMPSNGVKDSFVFIFLLFFIITTLVYLASYAPFFMQKQGLSKLFTNHINSVKFHYEASFKHVYLSRTWTWPLLIRPIWFYFKETSAKKFLGIICMGNPFVWWTFLPFFIYLIFDFFKNKKNELFFILVGYLCLYVFWFAAIKGGFFYYMLPASIFMYLTITYVLKNLWENNKKYIVFIYLFLTSVFFALLSPVIIAIPIDKKYFYMIMCLKNWI